MHRLEGKERVWMLCCSLCVQSEREQTNIERDREKKGGIWKKKVQAGTWHFPFAGLLDCVVGTAAVAMELFTNTASPLPFPDTKR